MMISSSTRSRGTRLFAATAALTLLTGCQSLQLGGSPAAQLRVIDASPDAGSVDSYQNGAALAYNLGFGMVTTYVPLPPGAANVAVSRAGTRQTLATTSVALAAGRQYTLIVSDTVAAMQQTLWVDQTQPAAEGQIAVRLIDEVTRGGAVDVYLVPGTGKLAFTTPFTMNLNFGGSSGYLSLPAATYSIVVVPAGTAPTSKDIALLSGAQVSYASGAVRTVVLIDSPLAATPFAASRAEAVFMPQVQAVIADDAD